jgi:hypothetical protein
MCCFFEGIALIFLLVNKLQILVTLVSFALNWIFSCFLCSRSLPIVVDLISI